jgi:hypothetical protein
LESGRERTTRFSYKMEIGSPARRGLRDYEIRGEKCEVTFRPGTWKFNVDRGIVSPEGPRGRDEPVEIDLRRLYLPLASLQAPYASTFAELSGMQFYHFEPEVLRVPQSSAPGSDLGGRGEHLGDVLGALDADYKARVDAYMRAVVPQVISIDRYEVGQYVTVALRAPVGDGSEVEFGPESISDGTIRATAVLAALFQPSVRDGRVRLVGIEEPEIALHPAAAGVLFDALTEASEHVQVIATSQSADLLDREDLDPSVIRPVTMRDGLTVIGEVDDASREIVKQKLYTLGELMRGNQLTPAPPDGGGTEA